MHFGDRPTPFRHRPVLESGPTMMINGAIIGWVASGLQRGQFRINKGVVESLYLLRSLRGLNCHPISGHRGRMFVS
jgi:NADH:ubiquinone oxidoreductase subunit F (NADH-binding)